MKYKFYKIFFIIILISNITFGQTKTHYSINDELFELPGKWELNGKIEKSGQYSFSSKKLKLVLLISVRKKEIFDFYEKEITDFEFLNKFYAWETEYWAKDDNNIEIEKIETNEIDKYIIWRLNIIDKNIESFIIHGIKKNKLVGIILSDNNKKNPKSRIENIEYVRNIYFKKSE